MRPLSAIDAISPAWRHTSRMLGQPRSWTLLLKFGLLAFFAGVHGCSSSYGNHSNNVPGHHGSGISSSFAPFIAAVVAAALLIAIVLFFVWIIFFYLRSRLQFVLFESVLRSDTTLFPIWSRYSAATWRWIGLKLLLAIGFFIVFAPFLIPLLIHFTHAMMALHGKPSQDPSAFFLAIATFGGSLFLMALIAAIVMTLVHSFGLPSMALEGTPISVTLQRVWSLVRDEPGQTFLYILMRVLLGIIGGIVIDIAVGILALIAAIPLGGIAVVDWFGLHNAALGGHIAMVAIWIILGIILLAVIILAALMGLAFLGTFLQAYAIYFLGGRYPLMAQYLDPFLGPEYHVTVAPSYYPPPTPPPAPGV